jgi:hypothetical protein
MPYVSDYAMTFRRTVGVRVVRDGAAVRAIRVFTRPQPADGKIEADVELELRGKPDKVLLRFRHPEKKPILAVEVNGRPHLAFDAKKGDVEIQLEMREPDCEHQPPTEELTRAAEWLLKHTNSETFDLPAIRERVAKVPVAGWLKQYQAVASTTP